MRYVTRVLGIGLAASWLVSGSVVFAQLGGGGGGSSGGGGGGGSSGGGSSAGGGGSAGQLGSGSTQPMTIGGSSLLGSFDNVGTGTTGRSGAGGGVHQSNLFAPYYVNPFVQGLVTGTGQSRATISTSAFGQPVFTNMGSSNSINGAGTGNRSTFGSTSMGSTRTGSGSGFGGTSTGGTASFGSTGTTGGSTGLGGGGSTGFGGTTGGTTGARSTGGAAGGRGATFAGTSIAPSIGRTGPSVTASLHFAPSPRIEIERRGDLQSVIGRSTSFTTPANVEVLMDSGIVVLRGSVGTTTDRRLAENMLRLQPGVRDIRNELEVKQP